MVLAKYFVAIKPAHSDATCRTAPHNAYSRYAAITTTGSPTKRWKTMRCATHPRRSENGRNLASPIPHSVQYVSRAQSHRRNHCTDLQFWNALWAIVVVGIIIFLTSLPISYYAARYGLLDMDLLTRGGGFGYLGSTITSLIYATFTFIFFALEAVIMAMALGALLRHAAQRRLSHLLTRDHPTGHFGVTLIRACKLWTQPLWLALLALPFVAIAYGTAALCGFRVARRQRRPCRRIQLDLVRRRIDRVLRARRADRRASRFATVFAK